MSDQSDDCRRRNTGVLPLPARLLGRCPAVSADPAASEEDSLPRQQHEQHPPPSATKRFSFRQLYGSSATWCRSKHGKPKSLATETSVSSRPVIVRTYTGGPSCRDDMPHPPILLPAVADFSFDAILHAVEPEIAGAIDAIAAMCARSKLSLADEYAAHRPPHEMLDPAAPISPPPQRQHWWSVVRDTALSAVIEASSSSGSRVASRASVTSATDHDQLSHSQIHHTTACCWLVSDSRLPSLGMLSGRHARAASPRVSLATSNDVPDYGSASLEGGQNRATGAEQSLKDLLRVAASSTDGRRPIPNSISRRRVQIDQPNI